MIIKYLVLSFLTVVLVTASDPYFGMEFSLQPLPHEDKGDVIEKSWMSTEAFKRYITDHDDRVSDIFTVTPYYYPNVNFWFLIYTQFSSDSVVIHDKTNLSLIYKVLDFSSLHEKQIAKNTRYVLQQKLSQEKVNDLKEDLEDLAKDPFSLTPASKKIYRIIKNAKINLPISKSARSIFFTKLKHNLRTQTGQKNFIRDGVMRSLPYQHFLKKYFTDRDLPTELLAIPFLESSFNPKAHSKAKALGVWQFMPLIASYYLPTKVANTDYRSNVGVASLAAGFLMSENYRIMKGWDLTVTAYNSGPKHLLRTKRELKRKVIDLEAIIKHSDSQHFGFASKNFYSEFLALVHTLAYKEDVFTGLHQHDRPDVEDDLKFYMTKCPVKLPKELNEKLIEDIHFHNQQIKDLQSQIPKGFILTLKSSLPKTNFLSITYDDLLKIKPKDWGKLLKNQSCSIK